MKITKTKLKQIIKEELAVILTNEEAGELFGEAIEAELDEKKKSFPDLTGDGKVTQADVLKGRGVELKEDLGQLAGLFGANPEELKMVIQGLTAALGNVATPAMLGVGIALAINMLKGGKDVDAAVRDAAEDIKQKGGKI